jgi:hypothetical protein
MSASVTLNANTAKPESPSTAKRLYDFVMDPHNVAMTIFEGILLYGAAKYDLEKTAKIIAVSSSLDFASHLISPRFNGPLKCPLTTLFTCLASQGHMVPLAVFSVIRL